MEQQVGGARIPTLAQGGWEAGHRTLPVAVVSLRIALIRWQSTEMFFSKKVNEQDPSGSEQQSGSLNILSIGSRSQSERPLHRQRQAF